MHFLRCQNRKKVLESPSLETYISSSRVNIEKGKKKLILSNAEQLGAVKKYYRNRKPNLMTSHPIPIS